MHDRRLGRLQDRPVIVVFARLPRKGRVKRRLAPAVGEAGALQLHTAFLQDTLTLARRFCRRVKAHLVLAHTGARPPARLVQAAAPEAVLIRQIRGALGRRLQSVLHTIFAAGAGPVLVLGADSPTLPETHLQEALDQLEEHEAVIDPAADGGYTLIGMSRFLPALFDSIPWGTGAALAATQRRARAAGIRLACLAGWYDVDDSVGLRRLQEGLAAGQQAPMTSQALRALGLHGAAASPPR